MVVFALVNNVTSGGYFIASDRASMGWKQLPHDLDREMEDVRRKGEKVEEVSIGLDGDWFLRTNARHACKTGHSRKDLVSNVEEFARLIQEAGLSLAHFAMQFFTFVPDPTGYVTVLHKTGGSLTRCLWRNVPRALDIVLEREASKGVRHVAVGMNGSYVVLLNTGVMWWSGVPASLNRLLDDAEKRGRAVVTVSLSLISDKWYFVEFADGATKFFLPPAWHDSINKFIALAVRNNGPRMSTFYPSAPSPYYPPLRAQFGSFNPVGQYSLANPPRYTPFITNPYLASVFTGMPYQQAPVYNITYVYNNSAPQEHKASLQDYNGMFKLLGGALKLAGAVLGPTMFGTGTGFGGF